MICAHMITIVHIYAHIHSYSVQQTAYSWKVPAMFQFVHLKANAVSKWEAQILTRYCVRQRDYCNRLVSFPLYESHTFNCHFSIHAHTSQWLPVAASSGLDGYIKIWDLETGKLLRSIDGGPGVILIVIAGLDSKGAIEAGNHVRVKSHSMLISSIEQQEGFQCNYSKFTSVSLQLPLRITASVLPQDNWSYMKLDLTVMLMFSSGCVDAGIFS